MVSISINNNKCQIHCGPLILIKIREEMRLRVPGAFYSDAFRKRIWDGYWYPVSEMGYFETGYLPKIFNWVTNNTKEKIEFEDNREIYIETDKEKSFSHAVNNPLITYKIPKKLGNLIPRDYQIKAIKSIIYNTVGDITEPYKGIYYPRGIIDGATNFGKLLTCALFYRVYKLPTIFLTNSKELFVQAINELEELLPGKIGFISSKEIKMNKVMVCMVQTMVNRKDTLIPDLGKFKILLVDEGDLATSKTYEKCIQMPYNAIVKICLTGTVFLERDRIKNEKIRAHFGEIVYTFTKKQMIERGLSSELGISIFPGNREIDINDYNEALELGIITNKERHKRIYERVNHHLKEGNYPILLIGQRKRHILKIYKYLQRRLKDSGWVIDWTEHSRKERQEITQNFKEGKIDILVGSMIYKRGKNFPLTRYVANIGGGKSARNVLQIMGRAERTHKSKNITYYEDFYDSGKYLKTHSNVRMRAYKNTGLIINEVYKNTIKKK